MEDLVAGRGLGTFCFSLSFDLVNVNLGMTAKERNPWVRIKYWVLSDCVYSLTVGKHISCAKYSNTG